MADDSLEVKIARLEERLISSDKALKLAEKLAGSQWTQIASVISILVSLIALLLSLRK